MKIPIRIGSVCLAGSLTALLLCSGCRKDLCYNHDEHSPSVKVQAHFQWMQEWEIPHGEQWQPNWPTWWETAYESLRPLPGKGVRNVVYTEGNGYTETNLPAEGGRLSLPEGRSSLLFYNNDTEYIVFSQMGEVATATATTRSVQRNGFRGMHEGERTMNPPDMLYGHFEADYVAERTMKPVDYGATLRPRVFTYLIRYEFTHGKQYIALARGALAGLAEHIYLRDGHTGTTTATILFDATLKSYGVEARVMTFGTPGYPPETAAASDGAGARYTVNLEVRLTNGRFKQFDVDVTGQLRRQPRGGVIQVKGLEITDEEGKATGGSAFDATVEGWGDYIDIPLPL